MGGNALIGFVERKNKEEHSKIVETVLSYIPSSAKEIPYIKSKESFGDADILIPIKNKEEQNQITKSVIGTFRPSMTHTNSNVFSFEYQKHQIDLIFIEEEYFECALNYFANNDLGGLMGVIAKKLGFKYGHKGLTFVVKDPTTNEVVGELPVSKNYNEIHEFLGIESVKSEFENFEEMFEYVTTSKYFNFSDFELKNRNSESRNRDSKRKTYMDFLGWCESNNVYSKELTEFETMSIRVLALKKSFTLFSNFMEEYASLLLEHERNKKMRELFNGNVVGSLTGLVGKELGDFMSFCKQDQRHHERVGYDAQSWVFSKFEEWNKNA